MCIRLYARTSLAFSAHLFRLAKKGAAKEVIMVDAIHPIGIVANLSLRA
jgi:hypothetical protein